VFGEILISQEKNVESEYYGAFINVWPEKRDANAYDNLQTLLTLREIIKTLKCNLNINQNFSLKV
jgi:hypothetical protein